MSDIFNIMQDRLRYISVHMLLLVFFLSGTGWADIFQYVDADGIQHFSNVPIDSRYKPHILTEKSKGSFTALSSHQRSLILRTIDRAADRFELEPSLIKAVIKAESNFEPYAVSSAGAMGLMQLMPKTALRWSVKDPFDPVENIQGGSRYLRHLLDLFEGNLAFSLAGYHAGEERVQKSRGIPPIPATQQYVKRVLKYYEKYQRAKAPRKVIYRQVLPTGEVIYSDTPVRLREISPARSLKAVFR